VTRAWLNRIGTAVPSHDIHAEFIDFARTALADARSRALFDRMADLADIEHRFSFFAPGPKPRDHVLDSDGFYLRHAFPTTGARMALYREMALALSRQAIAALDIATERNTITHLIVASCTGFTAPGLDFDIMQDIGLAPSVERTIVGFMGCFAAVNALRLARHIVRSEAHAKVLVVNLELSSLHLQEQWELEKMLSFLLFGGASRAGG
jgi:predicted naringenin-chalcone synthase